LEPSEGRGEAEIVSDLKDDFDEARVEAAKKALEALSDHDRHELVSRMEHSSIPVQRVTSPRRMEKVHPMTAWTSFDLSREPCVGDDMEKWEGVDPGHDFLRSPLPGVVLDLIARYLRFRTEGSGTEDGGAPVVGIEIFHDSSGDPEITAVVRYPALDGLVLTSVYTANISYGWPRDLEECHVPRGCVVVKRPGEPQ
jgi:hypothetical protein